MLATSAHGAAAAPQAPVAAQNALDRLANLRHNAGVWLPNTIRSVATDFASGAVKYYDFSIGIPAVAIGSYLLLGGRRKITDEEVAKERAERLRLGWKGLSDAEIRRDLRSHNREGAVLGAFATTCFISLGYAMLSCDKIA